jgi:hypothetical protein
VQLATADMIVIPKPMQITWKFMMHARFVAFRTAEWGDASRTAHVTWRRQNG